MNRAWMFVAGIAAGVLAGCHSDMYDQPRNKPLASSRFFEDGQASRPLVEGTVAHTATPRDPLLETGWVDGRLSTSYPFPVTREVLARGQERYTIYCSPCHGRLGDGKGMVVQRGFPAPPSYHTDSLRNVPVGHFVDVIARGIGRMFPYADRVAPADRWAIAAYIRALQLSQHLPADRLTGARRNALAGE